jgi:hypothetical protein
MIFIISIIYTPKNLGYLLNKEPILNIYSKKGGVLTLFDAEYDILGYYKEEKQCNNTMASKWVPYLFLGVRGFYCNLESHSPKNTARSPVMILARAYIEKFKNSPSFSRVYSSKVKAEKVVNPPQKPVANNKV